MSCRVRSSIPATKLTYASIVHGRLPGNCLGLSFRDPSLEGQTERLIDLDGRKLDLQRKSYLSGRLGLMLSLIT